MECKNCHKILSESAAICDKCGSTVPEEKPEIQYYSISWQRFLFLSIITFGLFEVFWFYKNWKAVKKFENSKIIPLGRAVFAILNCYWLFKRILKSAGRLDNQWNASFYSPLLIAISYIVLVMIYCEINTKSVYLMCLMNAISIAPLLIVQQAANYSNEKNHQIVVKNEFSVLTAIVFVFFAFFLFTAQESDHLISSVNDVVNKMNSEVNGNDKTSEQPISSVVIPAQEQKPAVDYPNGTPITPSQQADFEKKSNLMNLEAKRIKDKLALPRKVNDVTTLIDVTASPISITYHYELQGAKHPREITDIDLKNFLSPDICQEVINLNTKSIFAEAEFSIKSTQEKSFFPLLKDCK